jgi:thiol-disulfide isomerase/thioredoxin
MTATTARVRAAELRGTGWINTDRPLTLAGLGGKVVVLDFWTFCCINCLHVIEELRPLEERFGDRLVVIGVHSPKFPHEADHAAVERAVRRHRIHHPVLDDPDMQAWQQYGIRAWPTLVVIDPLGNGVAMVSGEGHVAEIASLIQQLLDDNAADVVDTPAPSTAAVRNDRFGSIDSVARRSRAGARSAAPGSRVRQQRIFVVPLGTLCATCNTERRARADGCR